MIQRLLLLAALLAPGVAGATSVVAMDPTDQAAESTAIVDAVVRGSVQVMGEDGLHYTETTLEIRDVVAGVAPRTVAVRQNKGTRPDGAIFAIVGDAELVEGERVVAFVREVQGHWYLTALGQSVWHVADDGSVEQALGGLELYERTFSGVVPSDRSPQTWPDVDALKADLRALEVAR